MQSKTWISVLLSLQALWNWNVCQSRVSVQLYLTRINCAASNSICRPNVTFCLQERDQNDESCPFGMTNFETTKSTFEDSDSIGITNSMNVTNPLIFFVNPKRFIIQLTVNILGIDILTHNKDVDVEKDLENRRRVSLGDGNGTVVEYFYAMQCDQMYYGSDCTRSSATEGLPDGATAAIVICVLLILTAAVGGGLTALLLAMYRPWAKDSKVKEARTRSTSKALNNPIYEEETFGVQNSIKNTTNITTNITSDGAADLRDLTLKNSSKRLEESSPLYASEIILEESQRGEVERSVFMDNKSLVNILDHSLPTSPLSSHQPQVVMDIEKGVATYDAGVKRTTTEFPSV